MELNIFRKDEGKIMEYVQKLPFLLGAAAAIVVGIISNLKNVSQQDTYLRMAISMIVFFAIGIYIRNTLQKIHDELESKKQEEENRMLDEIEEDKRLAAEEERMNQELKLKTVGTKIDFKIDDVGEDFSPLTVNEYIKVDK
jgi:divalent metal cation (Fe/Co/Zn/Cd) transporter